MTFYQVTIVNDTAAQTAYEANVRPLEGDARRVLGFWAAHAGGLDGMVQALMDGLGFKANAWRIEALATPNEVIA